MIPPSHPAEKITRWTVRVYWVVLHGQGEGYQQTKLLEVGVAKSSSGCQGGVPFPNSLSGPKFHKLASNRSNTIPWA